MSSRISLNRAEVRCLIDSLKDRGVKLFAEDNRLRIVADRGSVAERDLAALKMWKLEILQVLTCEEPFLGGRITRRDPQCSIPLTPVQSYWWTHVFDRGVKLSVRMSSFAMRIKGALDIQALSDSVQALSSRHETLRSRIILRDGKPIQEIRPSVKHSLTPIKVEGSSLEMREELASLLISDYVSLPIALSTDLLFETKLFRISDEDHILAIALDHLLVDGVSRKIIADELWIYYDRFAYGLDLELAALAIQMPDYAVWLDRTADEWQRVHHDYWIKRLVDAPRASFPRKPEATSGKSEEALTSCCLRGSLVNEVRELARREQTVPGLIIFSVFAATFSRWFDSRDFIAGIMSEGRWCADLQGVIGFVSSVLHLRVTVSKEDRFVDLLRRLTEEYRAAYDHQDFNRLLGIYRGYDLDLLFNWLNFEPLNSHERPRFGGHGVTITVEPFPLEVSFPSHNAAVISLESIGCAIGVGLTETPSEIRGSLGGRYAEMFRPYSIDMFEKTFETFLELCVRSPEAYIPPLGLR